MATRTISTKLAIDGESEYRASLQRINTELKTLQSALKLTESQYQTNANSMQALKAKGEDLNNLYTAQKSKVEALKSALDNAKAAEATYSQQKAELKAKIEANNKALEDLKKTTGDTSAEEARLTKENEELNKQLQQCDAALSATEKGVNSWQTQLNNAEVELNNLDAEIQKNNKYLDEAEKSSDGCATSIDEFGKEVDETAESVKSLSEILAASELQEFAKKITAVLGECVTASSDFEAQMAAVKRTTGMSDGEIDALGASFKKLSTEIPITTQELANIAMNAGQLGIAKENIEQFSIVMAQLATTTDLSAESAATMLAQFANITGIKTAEEYERLGSTVAALGDSTATTASKVVDMSQGIAAAGTMAGLNSTDILAISAAVGSLGIEAAAGSTAMSTLIQTLFKATQTGGEDLNKFASVAGMTATEFKTAWATDAAGALNTFIQGLNDTERNGQSAILVLESLGITNVRQTKAILGLAAAGDLLSSCIAKGNEAWEKNTALNEKAGVMYATLLAKTQKLDHASNNLKIAIGDALAPALGNAAVKGTELLNAVTGFIERNPELVESLTLVVGGIAGVTTGIASLKAAYKVLDLLGMAGGLKTVTAAAEAAGGGLSGLVAGLAAAGPILAEVAGGIALVTAAVAAVKDTVDDVKNGGLLGEGHTLEEYQENVENYRQKVEELSATYEQMTWSGADMTMITNELDMARIALANAEGELASETTAVAEAERAALEAGTELSESTEKQTAVNEAMASSLSEIAKAYKEQYDACLESLDGQIGLFDEYIAKINEDTDTAQELLDRWATQTVTLAEYTENLKKAAELGLDSGLVASLADGSAESAGYLSTIITEIQNCGNGVGTIGTSAEEAVQHFNNAFKMTTEAKQKLAETMTTINTDLQTQLEAMETQAAEVNFEGFWGAVDTAFANVGINFQEIGLNIGSGLSGGIDNSAETAAASSTALADGVTNAAKDALGVQSPSTVFHDIGSNVDQGLADGITDSSATVLSAAESLASQLTKTMTDGAITAVDSFEASFSQITYRAQAVLSEMSYAAVNATSGLPNQMYSIGSSIVDGMISGVYSRSGALYAAISSVVSNAIATARSAAGVHSPSKKTQEIFEFVGEGMIVGIESKKGKVSEATKDVVNNALKLDSGTLRHLTNAINNATPDLSEILMTYAREKIPVSEENGNGDINVTFTGDVIVSEKADYREFADYLSKEIRKECRRRGN